MSRSTTSGSRPKALSAMEGHLATETQSCLRLVEQRSARSRRGAANCDNFVRTASMRACRVLENVPMQLSHAKPTCRDGVSGVDRHSVLQLCACAYGQYVRVGESKRET